MISERQSHALTSIAEGLKLKYAELGVLVDAIRKQDSSCEFFRSLVTHVIPLIRKSPALKPLVSKWERETRASRKKLNDHKKKAIDEVTAAYNLLANRLKNSELSKKVQGLNNALDEAKGCLDGTRQVIMPSHFEEAADSLALACRLLVYNGEVESVSDLVKVSYCKKRREPLDIQKFHFYDAISQLAKENQKWWWDSFDNTFVCWRYLRLAEQCWNLKQEDFEREPLKSESIQDCERSGELLGLHGYWCEMQNVRSKCHGHIPFFTQERFSKHLEIICTEILTFNSKEDKQSSTLGIHALSLSLDGEYLILTLEEDGGRKKTGYELHKFNGISSPCLFMKKLIESPGNDFAPSDIGMQSGSSSNLLDRAKIRGALRNLFFKKGAKKASVQLVSTRILLGKLDLSTQLAINTQMNEMNLRTCKAIIG